MSIEPEIIIKGSPLDFELAELLGTPPSQFLVLCLNGVTLEGFGTPHDTPRERGAWDTLIRDLNDRSGKSRWPELWMHWRSNIRRQFALPETTTAEDFRPSVTYKISRVVCGYSLYLHAAIQLFEDLDDEIEKWAISHNGSCSVEIVAKGGATFWGSGDQMALAIAETVRDMLRATRPNCRRGKD
ncbi:MAG: hypothetical protein KIT22_10105 [Verrucomicrobiae bacterium]|nr:hypothetical protein [Verrucomicrobiae bacterium]